MLRSNRVRTNYKHSLAILDTITKLLTYNIINKVVDIIAIRYNRQNTSRILIQQILNNLFLTILTKCGHNRVFSSSNTICQTVKISVIVIHCHFHSNNSISSQEVNQVGSPPDTSRFPRASSTETKVMKSKVKHSTITGQIKIFLDINLNFTGQSSNCNRIPNL